MYILNEQEEELNKRVKDLISDGRIEEAKRIVLEAKDFVNKIVFLNMNRKIAKAEGDVLEEKRLLEILLELDVDNVKLMSRRIKIASDEGDIKTLRKLLDRQLELEPYNIITLRNRAILAKREGDLKKEEELIDRQIQLTPTDVKLILLRAKLAKKLKDRKKEKELLNRVLELEPENISALVRLGAVYIEEGDIETQREITKKILELKPKNRRAREWKKKLINMGKWFTDDLKLERDLSKRVTDSDPLDIVRNLIYGTSVSENLGKIRQILDGLDETTQNIVLAELYYISGLSVRAEKSLSMYKRKLESSKDPSKTELTLVRRAIELVKSKKTKRYNWDSLWEEKEKFNQEDER